MKQMLNRLLCIVLCLGLCACGNNAQQPSSTAEALTWQEQYDLGVRYLSEGKYEEAILAFTAAIQIDPKQAPAYIGLADVYIHQGEQDKALEILKQGQEATGGDSAIADKIAELEVSPSELSNKTSRKTTYDGAGTVLYYIDYAYDEMGRMRTAASYDGSGAQTGFAECVYDDKGQQIEGYYEIADQFIFPCRNTFDDYGRIIRTGCYDSRIEIETDYDSNGNKIEERMYHVPDYIGGETLAQQTLWEYDSKSVMCNWTIFHYEYDEKIFSSQVGEYDASGKLIKSIVYSADGVVDMWWEIQYNDEGINIGSKSYDSDGNLLNIYKCEYDDNGKQIREDVYDANGNLTRSTVEELL